MCWYGFSGNVIIWDQGQVISSLESPILTFYNLFYKSQMVPSQEMCEIYQILTLKSKAKFTGLAKGLGT